MPDWSAREALQAASERHQRELRKHTGYPRSNGLNLSLLCACGKDFAAIFQWESHLVAVVEAVTQNQ